LKLTFAQLVITFPHLSWNAKMYTVYCPHGGEDVDVGLLGCNAVLAEALKMETVCISEPLGCTSKSKRRYNPEN
jgi:hypothetical protein